MPDDVEAETARRILEALRSEGSVTIVAGGAISSSAASLTWARLADVTVLVVDRDRTRRDNVSYAVETLRLVRANLVGTVLSLRHPGRIASRLGSVPGAPEQAEANKLASLPPRHASGPEAPPSGTRASHPDVGAGSSG